MLVAIGSSTVGILGIIWFHLQVGIIWWLEATFYGSFGLSTHPISDVESDSTACKQQISHQNWPPNSWIMLASTEPHPMRLWLLWEWLQNSTLSMVEALWLVYPGKLQTPSKESHHQKVFLKLTKGLFTGAETKTGSSDTAKFCS